MNDTIRLAGEPVEPTTGDLTFIGTATVLLRCGGFTLLTDPNFLHAGDHAYLGLGLRSRRLLDPSMEIADLPPLDLVVLSHHHGDHFDHIAARDLDKDVPIVTEPHSARKLRSQGFRGPIALETWQQCTFTRGDCTLTITSTPGKHAPQPLRALLPPVMGSLLEFSTGDRVQFRTYITGDTLLYDQLHEIPKRFPDIDLCIIHLGGTRIAGILLTMDARQGLTALRLVRPRTAVPIHTDDYTVFKSGLDEFRSAVADASPALETEVCYVDRGETWRFLVPPR
ncbi:MAG TPA: MBL fold metallo-hydrolase [Ilumatobacteraceae bacterium]|jgi:L-ascorbate metabolism protein UlaG (beta-lactamase superfamily)